MLILLDQLQHHKNLMLYTTDSRDMRVPTLPKFITILDKLIYRTYVPFHAIFHPKKKTKIKFYVCTIKRLLKNWHEKSPTDNAMQQERERECVYIFTSIIKWC